MSPYIVLYHAEGQHAFDPPLLFRCQAEDGDHAEEQCADAEQGCEVLWVVQAADPEAAYADYWGMPA